MTIPRHYYSSTTVATTLSALVTAAQTTITVPESASNNGWPASYPFTLAIDYGLSTQEFVDVTGQGALNGSIRTWNVTRGVDGSTAQVHNANAVVRHPVVARDLTDAGAHIYATAGVHGVAGNVVGDSDAQTLTNKTFPSLSVSGSAALGTTVASRYLGATNANPPSTGGPFLVGDWVVDSVAGTIYVCTVAGTNATATWTQVGRLPTTVYDGPFTALGGGTAGVSFAIDAAASDHSHSAVNIRLFSNAVQSIPNITDTPLTYNVREVDDGEGWWTSATPNQVTLPTGIYVIAATVRIASSAVAVSERALWIRAGGTRYATHGAFTSAANQSWDGAASAVVKVTSASAVINIMAWQATGAALGTQVSLNGQRLTIVRVG